MKLGVNLWCIVKADNELEKPRGLAALQDSGG